jgi:nucleotide-binding universal stress UspA family protein
VVLARVQPWLTDGLTGDATVLPEAASLEPDAAVAAADYLRALRDAAPLGLSVRDVVLRGSPAVRLTALAQADKIDLVVMTSHARHGVSRTLLGSVAGELVRDGPPVLVVHPPAEGDMAPSAAGYEAAIR